MKRIPLLIAILLGFQLPVRAEQPPAILVLLEHGFNGDEFFGPTAAFRTAGYRVVVASSHEERVPLRLDQEPDATWDVPVDLAVADARPEDYIGLFVPGGYSPGFLETNPDAVRVARTFLEGGQPVGMVCHGPRLLLRHGLMEGRAFAGLFTLADELPDLWIQRPGRYLDQAVVRVGSLVTSRYPGDMDVFARHFLALLAEHGGIPVAPRSGRVALVLSNHPERWGNWHFFSRAIAAVQAFGPEMERAGAHAAEWVERVLDAGADVLALDVFPEDWEATSPRLRELALAHPKLVAEAGMRERLAARTHPTTFVEGRRIDDWTRAVVALAPEAEAAFELGMAKPAPVPEAPEFPRADSVAEAAVVLAVREGFDDLSAVAWLDALREAGLGPVAVVAEAPGEVRGVNGLTLTADAAYAEARISEQAVIVAPGFFWPQKNPRARQAEQPDWIEAREARDAARQDWLLAARERGNWLVLVGQDALRIGRTEAFEGTRFAASEQMLWSFGRAGARYTPDPATLSAPRLITARDHRDAADALRLLREHRP